MITKKPEPSIVVTKVGAVKPAASTGFQTIKLALRALKESADALPPLKAAVGGLLAAIDAIDVRIQIITVSKRPHLTSGSTYSKLVKTKKISKNWQENSNLLELSSKIIKMIRIVPVSVRD